MLVYRNEADGAGRTYMGGVVLRARNLFLTTKVDRVADIDQGIKVTSPRSQQDIFFRRHNELLSQRS
jgi:hypothetical protein